MPDESIQDEQQILSPRLADDGESGQAADQIADLTNKWKRAVADLENYKKRKDAESKELFEFAKEMAVAKLMPSLQNLEQVLKFAPSDEKYKDWLAGLKGTIMQLEKDMEEMGVLKIKTVGEKFDPTRHEAVEHLEGEEITKEIQPGFMINGKVIIPAKVIVGK